VIKNFLWYDYTAIWNKAIAFKRIQGRYPNYIDQKGYRVTMTDLRIAYDWVTNYKAKNKGANPETIPVTATIIGLRSVGPIQTAIEKKLGQFNNLTEYYNKMKGRGYSHYVNDVKTLTEELSTLANLNCSDASQVTYFLAKEMGYTARFVHLKCKSTGEGHIVLDVKGKELGAAFVRVDVAAAMSIYSKYPIGKCWCQDGTVVSYDDPWLLSDDGKN
jgi:hypothetical protein